MEPNSQTIEWWIKTGAVYGLGFILLAALSFIFVVVIWKGSFLCIGIMTELRHWVPTWFKADIATRQTFAKSLEVTTETLGQIGSSCMRTEDGTKHIVKAFTAHVSKTPGVGSDVIIHLQNAENVLLADEERVLQRRKERAEPGFGSPAVQ